MRATALLGAIVVLLWLTLPALVSPESVSATIRDEHRQHAAWLGEAAGHGILTRARSWLGRASDVGGRIVHEDAARRDPLSVRLAAVADAAVETPYVRALCVLGRLALYRLAALAEWFDLGLPLLLAATIDAVLMRRVKLRSFAHASPVLFGIGVHGTLAVLACIALALLVPAGLHPLFFGGIVVAFAATLRTAVSNFHRVG